MLSDGAIDQLASHGRARDELLNSIVSRLRDDTRIVCAWLTGSLALDRADDWSDVDLHVVAADHVYDDVLRGRMELFNQWGNVVLAQEIKVNTENPAHFTLLIFKGGLEVDCTLWTQRLAHRPPWSRLLFDAIGVPVDRMDMETEEERGAELKHQLEFFWAMAVVGCKTVGRSYTTGAAFMIELMTGAFDVLWRRVYRADEPRPERHAWRHRSYIPELFSVTPRLGSEIGALDALAVIRALCTEVERMHSALADLSVPIPGAMPMEIATLGKLAEDVVSIRNVPTAGS